MCSRRSSHISGVWKGAGGGGVGSGGARRGGEWEGEERRGGGEERGRRGEGGVGRGGGGGGGGLKHSYRNGLCVGINIALEKREWILFGYSRMWQNDYYSKTFARLGPLAIDNYGFVTALKRVQ